jgi:hypothetical protein
MKNVFLVLSLLVVLAVPALSQTYRFLPDPNAVLIDVFPVSVNIAMGSNGVPFPSKTSTGYDVITIIGSFRTQSGKVEYQMISDSIRFNGPANLIDNTSTEMIYAFLAQEAMFQGIIRGYTPAPECSAPWYANVYAEACVNRVGSGIYTHFVPCDRVNYSTWKYAVCHNSSDSTMTIARIPYANPTNCQGSCEPTCPSGSNSSIQ